MPPSPWPYFSKAVTKAFRNGYAKERDRLITFGLALIAAGVAAFRGNGNTFTWANFQWMPAAASFLVFLVLFCAFHFLRAQWEIYREQTADIGALNGDNERLRARLRRVEPRMQFAGLGISVPIGGEAMGICFLFKNANEDTRNVAYRVEGTLRFAYAGNKPVEARGVWAGTDPDGRFLTFDTIDYYEVDIQHGAAMKLIYLVQRGNSIFVPNSNKVPLQPGFYELVVEVT